MDNSTNTTLLLTTFLRGLATDIEKEKLTEIELEKVGEFFMNFLFFKNADKNVDNEDFLKFLTMGWYIYSQLKN